MIILHDKQLNELIKYSEGLKSKLNLKNSEIELYVVSTSWKELIIPFSSFKKISQNEVLGFNLKILDEQNLSVEKITPLKLVDNRLFSFIPNLQALFFIDNS